jgi:hypothetical protein
MPWRHATRSITMHWHRFQAGSTVAVSVARLYSLLRKPTPSVQREEKLIELTVKSKLENIGMVAIGSTPEELAALLEAEMKKWRPVIEKANIALD